METNTAEPEVKERKSKIALSPAVAEAYISRASVGTTANPVRRAHFEIAGQYIVRASGRAEVVVSLDPDAFNRAMAVREINKQIDGQYSVDFSTATTASDR